MYDELTEVDIKKMQDEIEMRILTLRPKLIADVQEARAYGDLSENFEYKEAKRQKNRNESRIRYLQRMVRTAKVVKPTQNGGVGLFDKVRYVDEDGEEYEIFLVTTLRVDAGEGRISRESPLGQALFGHKAGETVHVQVNADIGYDVTIQEISHGIDDDTLPIAQY